VVLKDSVGNETQSIGKSKNITKGGSKMKSKNFFVGMGVLALYILMASLWTAPASAVQELVPFMTPPAGGGAYILGAGMVSVWNKFMPGGIKFVHESSTGTMELVRRLMLAESQKKDSFSTFGATDAWNAYQGKKEYAGKPFPGLRSVVFSQFVDLYLVVPANSPIKSYSDLKGKRIGIGGPGSSVANTALLTIEHYGITKNDFRPFYYVYRETIEGIQNNSLDGGFLAGSYPIASYLELSTTHNVRIVPVDEKVAKKIVTEYPGYYQNVVKAKSYKGIEQDTPILGWAGAVWTHAGVSADLVYKFLKNLFDHKEDYYAIHSEAKSLTVENATRSIHVPFHPGAEKCLRELGAIK
jgi:TRAP transporter TAXI family solute receptor